MPKFVSLFIDRAYHRSLSVGIWLTTFLLVLVAGTFLFGQLVNQRMAMEARLVLEPSQQVQDNISSTLRVLLKTATAEACSPAFHDQLREIAFLPDGLNEFLSMSNGVVNCSMSADFEPLDLGVADVTDQSGAAIWYDVPLDFLQRKGVTGTIIGYGKFGIVVPDVPSPTVSTEWMQYELVNVGMSGRYWHRAGELGIFGWARGAGPWVGILPLHGGAYAAVACLPNGRSCVATKVPLTAVAQAGMPVLVMGILLSAILALGISGQIDALLKRFWSFDARFGRHFDAESVLCTYQPILSLATGKINGCEVLVRWRDVDGGTVYPDQFLPTVEKLGLSRRLTEFVIARAYAELSAHVPEGHRLQVNFNVFPRDLDAVWLRDTVRLFDVASQRFDVVVEIIETDLLQTEHAQREIEALRRFGIRTHLDDFGTGYSNIENLARLPIDGVKLDRSFAMSAPDSLMGRMLVNAIEMIHAAGHRITVEGVETEERLAMLKATGHVDFVQGYLIARPVPIERFVQLLVDQSQPTPLRAQLVA